MWQEPFDNDVKMYGIQTVELVNCDSGLFENDVKMYGIQTELEKRTGSPKFENDVKISFKT